MYKLTPLQKETMEFLKAQIDEARSHSISFENMGKEFLLPSVVLRLWGREKLKWNQNILACFLEGWTKSLV